METYNSLKIYSMRKRKSIAVLITLIYSKLVVIPESKRHEVIEGIECMLIDAGLMTMDEIIKEEVSFSKFIKDVTKYMEVQQLGKDEALDLVLKRYPQFRTAFEFLN